MSLFTPITPWVPATFPAIPAIPSFAGLLPETNDELLAQLAGPSPSRVMWADAQARMVGKAFTTTQIEQAADALVAALQVPKPPIDQSTAMSLLAGITSSKAVTGERLARLCETVIPLPTVDLAPKRVRAGTEMYLVASNALRRVQPPSLLMAVRSCTVDGKALKVVSPTYAPGGVPSADSARVSSAEGFINFGVRVSLPAGPHTLRFVIDMGLSDAPVRSFGEADAEPPGQKEAWKALCTWERTIDLPIVVVPWDAPLYELVTDSALDPTRNACVRPTKVLLGTDEGHRTVRVLWAGRFAEPVPVRAWLLLRQSKRYYDPSITFDSHELNVTWMMSPEAKLPKGNRVEIVLRPLDPRVDLDWISADRVWGKEIVFTDVPLVIEPAAPTSRPATTPTMP